MKVPLDLIPMALCGLATIVSVAVILVASDLLRRLVLFAIARIDPERRARISRTSAGSGTRPTIADDPGDPPEDRGARAIPG